LQISNSIDERVGRVRKFEHRVIVISVRDI